MPGAVRKAKVAARQTIAAVTSPRTPKTLTPSVKTPLSASTPSPLAARRKGRTSKRKLEAAPEEAAGSSEADVSSNILHPHGDASEDEFVEKPSRARRKAPTKKAVNQASEAVTAAVVTQKPTSASRPQQQARKAASASNVEHRTAVEEEEGDLFTIIKAGKAALQSVVDDWIDVYKKDKDKGMMELMQFFVQSSGCRGKITAQMYRRLEHSDLIRKLTEEFEEESCSYPLVTSGQTWRRFRAGMCEFVGMLVRRCQHGIIYDGFLADRLINFLTGLADSQVRAFRHTSTLVVMKLMSALVDVALYVHANLHGTQQQQESERLVAAGGRRGGDRSNALAAKAREWQQNQEELNMMMQYIFKGVFVHRYRDVVPDIRCICISEIGYWMRKYPAMFLEDSYLKYVGWTLFDKVGEVRLTCLRTLQPLYQEEDLATNMALFTNRFKDRIVEMALDKEYDVAVAAIKLVTGILRYNEQVLTDKDCENVYELVYSAHRGVAQAAGEFLNAKIFKLDSSRTDQSSAADDQQATPVARSKRTARRRNPHMPLVRDLVLFFIESELHEHAAYLVDSLWEYGALLKDWQCMTDALLEEPARGEEPLDDKQESCLIEIMRCCATQAASGQCPVGRGPSSRKLTAKELKQAKDDKATLTKHFIVALPQLLSKYSMDAAKVVNLMGIPLQFDLEVYTINRQEKELDSLLKQVQDIVEKHSDTEVLDACARVVEYVCDDEAVIGSRAEVAKGTMVDAIVSRYTIEYARYFDEDNHSEDASYALYVAVRRLQAFAHCVDVSSYDLWDGIVHILKSGGDGTKEAPSEVLCSAIPIGQCLLLWHLNKVDSKASSAANVKQLKERLSDFIVLLQDLMYHTNDKIVGAAYVTVCDLLVVFGGQLAVSNPALSTLVFLPSKNLQVQLIDFLKLRVFVDDDDSTSEGAGNEDDKIEMLHSRRNFLASFAKLVAYNIIGIRNAAVMFEHFGKFINDYGDIIKYTFHKSREINKVATAKTLAVSLTKLYSDVTEEQGGRVVRGSAPFVAIKDLARRFALSFGLDAVKNREAIVALHREGIIFSLQPDPDGGDSASANLAFLDILAEFTGKLIKQDKKAVVAFLDKQLRNSATPAASDILGGGDGGDNDWQPLLTYRAGLAQYHDQDSRSLMTTASSIKSGKSTALSKRKKQPIDMDSSFKTPTARRGGQPFTSTAVKRRRVGDGSSASALAQLSESAGSEADFEAGSRLTASAIAEEDESAVAEEEEAPSISEFSSPAPLSSAGTPMASLPRSRRRAAPAVRPASLVEEEEEEESTLVEEKDTDMEEA